MKDFKKIYIKAKISNLVPKAKIYCTQLKTVIDNFAEA